ncbi:MAG: hypothetical protein COV47_05890 [Candidatus Diapherotrites archaeon CG11_big_fil_rev_8_21_14_0_20_37_9]|nr:MAG: hypothetical protein COV47_05890 [Candidatus Diapherotrites archaeon CG11_big_fil_rev_8_21_14_0_20_37_9]
MNSKGFTLFTALVAFILISLSILLVNSMVSSERNNFEIISDISEQQEMQAIADLTRADALQVFNFGIRYSIESFSKEDNRVPIGEPDNPYILFATNSDWDSLQENFIAEKFGIGTGDSDPGPFATLTASHMTNLLSRAESIRGFEIELAEQRREVLARGLQRTLNGSSSSSDFLELVNCDSGNYSDCVGTFYVTLDLSRGSITDSDYEDFPQISVTNNLTERTLREPILPRGKFRIYVPVRLFKALAGARAVGFASGDGVLDDSLWDDIDALPDQSAMESRLDSQVSTLVSNNNLEADDDGFYLESYKVFVLTDSDNKLLRYDVDLIFKEDNPKYRVESVNIENKYMITLRRNRA